MNLKKIHCKQRVSFSNFFLKKEIVGMLLRMNTEAQFSIADFVELMVYNSEVFFEIVYNFYNSQVSYSAIPPTHNN